MDIVVQLCYDVGGRNCFVGDDAITLYEATIKDKMNIKRAEYQRKHRLPMSYNDQAWEEVKLRLPRVIKNVTLVVIIVGGMYILWGRS